MHSQNLKQWVADKIVIAERQGYIDTAFGLRIRTPIVGKSVLNTSKTPFQASAEARSVGNAISGQSYGLLTNRAMNAIMEKVWKSQYPIHLWCSSQHSCIRHRKCNCNPSPYSP